MILDAERVDVLFFHPFGYLLFGYIFLAIPKVRDCAVLALDFGIALIELYLVNAMHSLLGTYIILQVVVHILVIQVCLIDDADFAVRTFRKILHNVGIIFAVPIKDAGITLYFITAFKNDITTTVNELPFFFGNGLPYSSCS